MKTNQFVSYLLVAVMAGLAGIVLRGWVAPGGGPGAGREAQVAKKEGPCPGGGEALYWKAPMDPTYIREEPGKSPMGMDLVPACQGEGDAAPAGGITIDPNVIQNIGVRTALTERRDLARKIRAVGRVDYDERLVKHVHTKIQGWVERLQVEYEGQEVKLGQPLLEIYSPELVSTQEELLLAARYRSSTGESTIPDVRKGGEALFEATRRRLELWDIPDRDIDRLLRTKKIRKTLTLYAPTQGVVTHMMVREGMEVGPNDNLYTIADLSRVWVYADVYEYELPWVKAGQPGRVELSYLPGVSFEGEVTYVYPFLDPKTRTARVRLELPNPDLHLKPDMFANVTIQTAVHPDVVAVPEEAVIRSGKRSLVIIDLGKGRFAPREVEVGLDAGDGWLEVKKGLEAGERTVVSSQFLIDSESKLQAAVQKLLQASSGAPARHEGHKMPEGAPAGDHAGHDMGKMPAKHEGHEMPEGHGDHAGHDMGKMPAGHEGHEMPEAPGDHAGGEE
jgi:multidrug efflux pump subunit AcrA (membrane-fusion protein)